jgi:hypothetical protein
LIGRASSRAAVGTAMFLWDMKVPPSPAVISHR